MAYTDLNSKLDWAMSFQRTGKFPIDRSSMFASYEDALAYARQDGSDSRQLGGTSYVGQIVVVYSDSEVSAYLITAVGAGATLVKLAATTASGDLAEDVVELQTQVGQLEGKVTALEEKDSPTRTEFTTLSGKVTANEGNITQLQTDVDAVEAKAATNEGNITALTGRVDTAEDDIDAAEGRISALEGKIVGLTGAMHYVGKSTTNPAEGTVTIDGKPEYAPAEGDVVIYNSIEYVYDGSAWSEFGNEGSHITRTEVEQNYLKKADATATYATKESVSQLDTAYKAADTALDQKITTVDGKITAEVSRAQEAEEALDARVEAIEGAGYITTANADAKYVAKAEGKSLVQDTLITKLEGLTEIKSVNSAEFDINAESKELSVKAVEQSKVTGLVDALGAKAEKTVVSGLSASVGTSEDAANAEGTVFARIAQLKADLTNVEQNAGKIDIIKVNGVALEIQEKAVNIPLATAEAAGAVKGAADNNKVAIGADGTMSVNNITTDKLVQGSEELVLNGGSAA